VVVVAAHCGFWGVPPLGIQQNCIQPCSFLENFPTFHTFSHFPLFLPISSIFPSFPSREFWMTLVGMSNHWVFDVAVSGLVGWLRFWCCQVQKLRTSRWIASFWMLSSLKTEAVSQNSFVFKLADR
jgi:hypothetical protein